MEPEERFTSRSFRARVRISILFAPLLVLGPALAEKVEAKTDWTFFIQKGRAFEPLRADPRAAHFQIGLLYGNKGLFEDFLAGGDLAFLAVRFSDGRRLTITGRGVFASRFNVFSESFDLMNVDFIGGLATGFHWEPMSTELFVYHQSSHLGDEILDRGDRQRIDFGYEAIRFLVAGRWRFLKLYAGWKATLHAYPASLTGRVILQSGLEARFAPGRVPLFAALDSQVRVDRPRLRSLVVKAGVGLGRATGKHRLQYFFIEYFEGRSPMGQFYAERERYGMVGVSYLLQ